MKQEGICVYGIYLCSEECSKEYDFEVMKTNKDEMKQCFNIKEEDEAMKEALKSEEVVDLDFESV